MLNQGIITFTFYEVGFSTHPIQLLCYIVFNYVTLLSRYLRLHSEFKELIRKEFSAPRPHHVLELLETRNQTTM